MATTWKIYGSSGSERGVGMFHGDIFGDWREESILVNYDTKELVIFTTDIASEHRFYSLMQNPCYRMGTTAKGYVQASMLDYFLGYGMDMPPKPDIEIIGGLREESFADVNSSSAEIAGPQSSSAAEGISSSAEGTEGITAAESMMQSNAISGRIEGSTLRLEGIDGGAHDISIFDMQGHRIAEFRAVQGSELHVTLRQGA